MHRKSLSPLITPPVKYWICDICDQQNIYPDPMEGMGGLGGMSNMRRMRMRRSRITEFCSNCQLMEKRTTERQFSFDLNNLEEEEEQVDNHQTFMIDKYRYQHTNNYKDHLLRQIQYKLLLNPQYKFNQFEHKLFRATVAKLRDIKETTDKNQFKTEIIQPLFTLFGIETRMSLIDKVCMLIPNHFFRFFRNMFEYYRLLQDIKNIENMSIPIIIETMCLSYYESKHHWNKSIDLKSDTLSINGNLVTVNRKKSKYNCEFGMVCVDNIVSSGFHKWTFRINKNYAYNRFDLGIGITDLGFDPDGCLFNEYSLWGCIFSWNDDKYAFEEGDIISMILDFNSKKLKFIVNEYAEVTVCSDIENGQYCAAVCMHKDKNCIELF